MKRILIRLKGLTSTVLYTIKKRSDILTSIQGVLDPFDKFVFEIVLHSSNTPCILCVDDKITNHLLQPYLQCIPTVN